VAGNRKRLAELFVCVPVQESFNANQVMVTRGRQRGRWKRGEGVKNAVATAARGAAYAAVCAQAETAEAEKCVRLFEGRVCAA